MGGSIPVIWSYYCEFLPAQHRGRMLSVIATFWMIGTLIFSGSLSVSWVERVEQDGNTGLGWVILPTGWYAEGLAGFGRFRIWRLFIAVSTLLCLSASAAVALLPESPKFLLEVGPWTRSLLPFPLPGLNIEERPQEGGPGNSGSHLRPEYGE